MEFCSAVVESYGLGFSVCYHLHASCDQNFVVVLKSRQFDGWIVSDSKTLKMSSMGSSVKFEAKKLDEKRNFVAN